MRSDGETTAVREFIMSRSDNMETAAAVHHAWLEVRDRVSQEFLVRLDQHIEEEVKADESFPDDVVVGHDYGEGRAYKCCIWLYRKKWTENENGKRVTRTSIHLENQKMGLTRWCIGIRSPMYRDYMEDADAEKHDRLAEASCRQLGQEENSYWWPWWKYLDDDMKDWDSLVPDLWAECGDRAEGKKCRITAYTADAFLDLARKAMPIINDIELGKSDKL